MADAQLPTVTHLDAYRAIYHHDDIWRPVIEAICQRHSYLDQTCERGPDGTHIVYFVGSRYVVKLFVPLFGQDFEAEYLVAEHLTGKMDVAIPEMITQGQIDGWNYLVMTRVPGIPLHSVWGNLKPLNRRQIAIDVGQMIAQLRSLPVAGLEELTPDWSRFLETQIVAVSTHHPAVPELIWEPNQEIKAFFDTLPTMMNERFQPALLLADITREHVLVDQHDGSWRMVGYIDFGDAMVGHPDYELVAPGLEIAGGNPELLRALLLASGYKENNLEEALCRRLMAYTLIHRYVDLNSVFAAVPQARNAASIDDCARLVWPVYPLY